MTLPVAVRVRPVTPPELTRTAATRREGFHDSGNGTFT